MDLLDPENHPAFAHSLEHVVGKGLALRPQHFHRLADGGLQRIHFQLQSVGRLSLQSGCMVEVLRDGLRDLGHIFQDRVLGQRGSIHRCQLLNQSIDLCIFAHSFRPLQIPGLPEAADRFCDDEAGQHRTERGLELPIPLEGQHPHGVIKLAEGVHGGVVDKGIAIAGIRRGLDVTECFQPGKDQPRLLGGVFKLHGPSRP